MLMPRRIKLQALFSYFRGSSPKKTVQPAVADPEAMGYAGFYMAVLNNVSMHDLTAWIPWIPWVPGVMLL